MNLSKLTKTIVCLLILISTLFINNYPLKAQQIDNSYMIVIDASGSMSSNTRMERAKNAAESFLNSLKGKNIEVGLIAFYDCNDIRVLHALTNDVEDLIDPLRSIQPSGGTPLAGSITFGGSFLKTNGIGAKGKLIVYTDGGDTCNGNYTESKDAIDGLEIDLWGIDLPATTKEEIEDQLGGEIPVQALPDNPQQEVERIELFVDGIPDNLFIGQSFQLNLKERWSDGSITMVPPTSINYKSIRPDRVEVSEHGILTAKAKGIAYIDLEYDGEKIRISVTVSPAPSINDFFLGTQLPLIMTIGDTHTISGLKAKWSNGTVTDVPVSDVTLSSSRSDRISVDENGELKALVSGTSYIDISYKGKQLRNLISVESAPTLTDFYLTTSVPSEMTIGDTHTMSGLKAKWSNGTVTDVPVSDVTLSSSRSDRISVDENGELKALVSGTSYIDISYKGKQLRNLVSVESAPTLTDFYLTTSVPSEMTIGDTHTISGLKAKWSNGTVTDVPVSDVTLSSSRSDRISVDENGELKALMSGTSYIDISYKGKQLRNLISVESAPTLTDFYLTTSVPSEMTIGDTHTISGLKAKWSNGTVTDVPVSDVTLSSSRSDRISVDDTGELVALMSGKSYIDILYNRKNIRLIVAVGS